MASHSNFMVVHCSVYTHSLIRGSIQRNVGAHFAPVSCVYIKIEQRGQRGMILIWFT